MPEKKYRIGAVADELELKSFVLRYWESEFPKLAPKRTAKGQRFYTDADIDNFKLIKHLLHEKGMTVAGAKKVFLEKNTAAQLENIKPENIHSKQIDITILQDITTELTQIKKMLEI